MKKVNSTPLMYFFGCSEPLMSISEEHKNPVWTISVIYVDSFMRNVSQRVFFIIINTKNREKKNNKKTNINLRS